MKRLLYFPLVAASLLFAGCAGEEDDIFSSSAAERLNEASDKYSALLESSEGGWVIQYYPTNDGAITTGVGYLWCVKFNTDHSVRVGMNNYFTGNVFKEETSGWDVITDNGPVLTFNTMNSLVHAFSDPDIRSIPGNDEDVWGVGVGGDYEFVIVDAPEDHSYVMLKGKKRGTYNLMTPLPAGADFQEYLADVRGFTNKYFPSNVINPVLVQLGDTAFLASNMNSLIASWYPQHGDAITETSTHPFTIYKNQDTYYLRLRENLKFDGDDTTYKEFAFDTAADKFVATGGINAAVSGVNANLFFDEWIEEGHRWNISLDSIHSDGITTLLQTLRTDLANQTSKYEMDAPQLKRAAIEQEDGTKEDLFVLEIPVSYNTRKMGKTVKVTAYLDFGFDYEATAEGIKLTYREPVNVGATNMLAILPSLKSLVEGISGTYQAQGRTTALVLNTMTLKSGDVSIGIGNGL